jgi:hypothetical protein
VVVLISRQHARLKATLTQPSRVLSSSGAELLSDGVHVDAEDLLDVAGQLGVVPDASQVGLKITALLFGGVAEEGDVSGGVAAGGPVDAGAAGEEAQELGAEARGGEEGGDLGVRGVGEAGGGEDLGDEELAAVGTGGAAVPDALEVLAGVDGVVQGTGVVAVGAGGVSRGTG